MTNKSQLLSQIAVGTLLMIIGTSSTPVHATLFDFSSIIKDFIYVKPGNGSNAPTGLEVGDSIQLTYNLSNIPANNSDFDFEIDSYSLIIGDRIITNTGFDGAGSLDGSFEISLLHGDTGFFVNDPLGIESQIPVDFLISSITRPNLRNIDVVFNGFVNNLSDTATCHNDPGNTIRCFEGSWFSAGAEFSSSSPNSEITVPEPTTTLGFLALGIAGVGSLRRKRQSGTK